MLGLLQGGEAAALIMEPTPIAQAMRQTAVAPARPCLCERIVNRVTQLRISLSFSLCRSLLSVCEHVVKAVCDKAKEKYETLCF